MFSKVAYMVLLGFSLMMHTNSVNSCETNKYSTLLQNANYQINYEIDYKVNESNSDESYIAQCVVANCKERGIDFLERNAFYPNSEYQYRFLRYAEVDDVVYYKEDFKKNKPIDHRKWNLTKRKWGTSSEVLIIARRDQKILAEDELFSMLGKITEDVKKLPNYKVNLIRCGSEFIDGENYKVDEFKIIEPYAAVLKLYYLNGVLVKCIKILDSAKVSNQTFPYTKSTFNGYVVVNIKRFDDKVDDEILNIGNEQR